MNISKALNINTIGNKDEIKNLLKNSKKIYTKFGLIFLNSDESENCLKVAILVKKSCGNAVKRNYIKRIIRHFVREKYNILKRNNRIIFLYRYPGNINYNLLKNEFICVLK